MRKRNEEIVIRCTQAEKDDITARARRAEMTLQGYLIASALGKKIYVDESRPQLEELRKGVQRIGQNVNQIARGINTVGATYDESEELGRIENDLSAILMGIREMEKGGKE